MFTHAQEAGKVRVLFNGRTVGFAEREEFDKRTGGTMFHNFRFAEGVRGGFVDWCLRTSTKSDDVTVQHFFVGNGAVVHAWSLGRIGHRCDIKSVIFEFPNDVVEAAAQQKDEPALRYDAGKPRFDLVPPDALEELAAVYAFGATKYAEDNWTKGMAWRRCVGSALRHIFAWASGEQNDRESGRHHLAHAAWNLFTLVAYEKRGLGNDDRVKLVAAIEGEPRS
jgi:hypothetical protein